ncbi:LnmK family bifunctional acyltransferase/decarboxylase [Nonomuraea sp. NPDC005692]|uniref:LnmK family bifunctional acyltransferase/decarboxylase n=1 Tax=Nonomuraea sp. NPDC005692 TaxID=3157168 RepID=UPI0033D6379F
MMNRIDDSTVTRTELVKPGMCGPSSLFMGEVGDWTWDTVSALCGTNAFDARNAAGDPTYLSFYYFHVRGSRDLHVNALTFGDELAVTSRLFGFGSESVLALHRIGRGGGGTDELDPDRFYAFDDPGCIYVETFNRWISRSAPGSNEGLVKSSPVDFRHEHLPTLPGAYSPRKIYGHARSTGTFLARKPDDPVTFTADYPVEPSRDLNGVGLLYFASYFAIVDWVLLRFWRSRGIGVADFLRRVVLDQRLCYLGNANADSVLRVSLECWPAPEDENEEIVNLVMEDRGRTIAVSTLRVLRRGDTDDDA